MRLTETIHLVASGGGGFGLTDPFDCHVYLVDGGSEAALVDSGIGSRPDQLLENVVGAGVAPERIRTLFLTHAHPDHSGGAAALKQRLPDLRVLASSAVATWVASGDEEAMSVEKGKRAHFYPAGFRHRPCPVDGTLREGDVVGVGELDLRCVETPGHSAGHLSFLLGDAGEAACFCGDLIFHGGEISLVNNWDCVLRDYVTSLRKLREAGIDALLPGHHSISLRDGQSHVETANRLLDNGFVPRSIV